MPTFEQQLVTCASPRACFNRSPARLMRCRYNRLTNLRITGKGEPHRLEVADVFRQYEEEFLERWRSLLSYRQFQTLRDIGACRTAALGAHLHQCDGCQRETLVYNSCLNRHCPRCGSNARDRWLAAHEDELLPTAYSHVIFTLPHELIPLALQNPALVYGIFFRAVSQALLTIASDARHLGARLGFLAVLHTWSQKLLPHPHIHCLVPAGGIALDQKHWIACRNPKFFLPAKALAKKCRGKFLALLRRTFRKGKLRLAGALEHLQDRRAFDRFTFQLKSKDWVVYAKKPFSGPQHVIQYLAHYTHRVAISNGRLLRFENGQVTFRWRDSAHGNKQKAMTLDAVEFMRRFLLHVLPRGFVKIRHFGYLANRERKRSLPLCRTLLSSVTAGIPNTRIRELPQPRPTRRCPYCQTGTLIPLGRLNASELQVRTRSPPLDTS